MFMSKNEEKKENLTPEEQVKQLEIKCKALENLANQFKASIPYMPQIGRPIQLTVFQNNFIYTLTLPDVALANIEQFKDLHSVISKFSAITSEMEKNATAEIAKNDEEKKKEEE